MDNERVGAVTFKGKPLTVVGEQLCLGSRAPDVTMRSGPLTAFRLLGDTAGKIRIISVVPCIETGVCETQTLRVNKEVLGFDHGVVALAVSSDLTETQWRWSGQSGVANVTMLSDHMDMAFGSAFGTWIKELRKEQRAMFVIDSNDVVRYAEYVPEVGHHPDYDSAFAVVRSLLSDSELSPNDSANRQPTEEHAVPPQLNMSATTRRIDPSSFFDWVTIPAGAFIMGSDPKSDPNAWDDDQPRQMVELAEFQIARVPVTNLQYRAFVEATGYVSPAHWVGEAIPPGKDNHPVVEITWYDALNFCTWAMVRLPTEAEWEKAARGTDGRIFPWGNEKPNRQYGNFSFSVGDTTPVGQYRAGISPYGLLDAAGNVWEWTTSKEWPYPYDAHDGREDLTSDDRRILRGAAFRTVNPARCAFRGSGTPPHYRSSYDGFRVARSAEGA